MMEPPFAEEKPPGRSGILFDVSDEALKSILNTVADPIFVKDRKHRWVLLNEAYCSFMGYPMQELIGKSDYDFFPKAEAEVFWAKDEVVFNSGQENVNEEEFTDSSGVTRTIVTKKRLYSDSAGNSYIVGIIRDITERKQVDKELHKYRTHLEAQVRERTARLTELTKELKIDIEERKQAETALRESEEKYRQLVELSPDGIAVHSGGKIVFANSAGAKIVGASGANEIIGKSLLSFVHPDYRKIVTERVGKMKTGRIVPLIEEKFIKLDGTTIDVDVAAMPLNFNQLLSMQVIFRDITERKTIQAKLEESERRYKSTINSMSDLIHMVDPAMKILICNRALQKWINAHGKKEDAVGKSLFHVFPFLPKSVRTEYDNVFKSGRMLLTVERTSLSGQVLITETRKIPVLEAGKVVRVVTVIRDITQAKTAEERITKTLTELQHIFDMVPTFIWKYCVTEDRFIYASKMLTEISGIPLKSFLQDHSIWDRRVDAGPESQSALTQALKAIKQQESYQVEYVFHPLHSSPCWLRVDAAPVQEDGKLYYYGHTRDVTSHKLAELEVGWQKDYYEGLLDNANIWIDAIDQTGRLVLFNKKAQEITGYRKEELIGTKRLWRLVYPNGKYRRARIQYVLKLLSQGKTMKDSETEIHTKDGRRLIISWTSNIIRDKQGRIKGSLFIGNDITEKRRAEEEIAGIKHHLETVLDGISESIVVLDHKYRIVSYNKAFRNWVKEPLSDFRGKKCFRIIHGALQSCRKCVIRDVFSRKGPSESIHYHQTKNGRIYHETRAYPIFRDGKITESIYVFRDVSEREQMREQLRDNYEKLVAANQELMKLDRMKTEFLSIASHELRTPLAVIKGYADILTSGDLGGLNLEQKSRLERINRNVEHLDILVNNILDLTRMEAGELRLAKTRFSLQRLIRVVTDDMANIARQKGIRIDITVSAKTRVFADRMRLRQVLVNIIDNALKFTPDNGAVKISSWQRQGRLFVEVSDNGIGIRKKDIKNLFQRFYQVDSSIQRKYRGTGLGLAICKRIVELHGGEISIKSKHKKGTTISFTIPSK